MSADCSRAGRWIGGCKFEPRYDLSEPDQSLRDTVRYADEIPAYTVKLLVNKSTYVRDVCVRCGKTIERSGE